MRLPCKDTGREICAIESGSLDFDGEAQDLYAGMSIGLPYELDVMRLRYLGGSSNHWAGQCAPLTAMDFEERPWVPHSGWPITREQLQPFYVRAQSLCTLGDYLYDSDEVWRKMGLQPDPFDPAEIQYRFFSCHARSPASARSIARNWSARPTCVSY
jgi:choline dehydrogenase-like flavoprotein